MCSKALIYEFFGTPKKTKAGCLADNKDDELNEDELEWIFVKWIIFL